MGDGARSRIRDDLVIEIVEIGFSLQPVAAVLGEMDVGAFLPLLEHERSGSDRRVVGRIGAEVGTLVDVFWDDRAGRHLEHQRQRRKCLLERDLHGEIVDLFDLVDLRIGDRPPARADLAQELVEREDDVVGGERLAVMPDHALLQVERVDFPVGRGGPTLGERGLWVELFVKAQQQLVDVAGDHVGRRVLAQSLHQDRRFGLDDDMHRLVAGRRLCGRRRARCKQQRYCKQRGGQPVSLAHLEIPRRLARFDPGREATIFE